MKANRCWFVLSLANDRVWCWSRTHVLYNCHSVHKPFNFKQIQTHTRARINTQTQPERQRGIEQRNNERKTSTRLCLLNIIYRKWLGEESKEPSNSERLWMWLLPMIQYTPDGFFLLISFYFSYRLTIESTTLAFQIWKFWFRIEWERKLHDELNQVHFDPEFCSW